MAGQADKRIHAVDTALETDRLLLRRLTTADAAALQSCTGDPLVMRYWYPGPDADVAAAARRIAEIDAHWQRYGFGDYAVLARESDELIGFAGLHHIAGIAEVNVGYALLPACWRRGLGRELCLLFLRHGLVALGLPEIVAVIDPRNLGSVALAGQCGLVFCREFTWQGQQRELHALTRTEFEAGLDHETGEGPRRTWTTHGSSGS